MNRSRWILAITFFGVIFGGTLAFWLVEDRWTFLDALYMTVISVTTVGYGEVHELSSAGRVVAMVVLCAGLGVFGLVIQQVTSYAVGGALSNAVERRRIAGKVAAMSGHTVICGFGSRGQALVAGMGLGKCVAIERDEDGTDSDALKRLKQQGGVAIAGDARDEMLLQLAGVDRAAQVVVAAGSDETNLEVARVVRHRLGRGSKTRVVTAIEEYASRDWFEDKLHRQGIEPIGLREQSLLVLARKLALEQVGGRNSPPDEPLRITVQASGSMLGELLRVLVMVMQLGGSQKPEISVFGCDRHFVSVFEARFPEYGLCCGISWEEGEFGSRGVAPESPDLALFAMESNLRSLELAERCLSRYPDMKSSQVVACLGGAGPIKVLAQVEVKAEESPYVVSIFDFLSRKEGIVTHAMDVEGCRLHEQYCANADYPVQSWSELSEFHRNSNRLAALQRDVYQQVWENWRGQTDESELLEYLGECEHMRWMAFHVMNGYRHDKQGVSREQRLRMKVHSDLVEYHDLTEEGKEKDRENVRAALR